MVTPLDKLLAVYKEHGRIVVGVDFDDTVFAWDKNNEPRAEVIRDLLKELQPHIIICLYSVADDQSLRYKREIMKLWGIPATYVNASPLDGKWGDSRKPFFNILLDDKAGLEQQIDLLMTFKQTIE